MHVAVEIGTEFFSNGGWSASYFGRGDLLAIGPLVSVFLRGAFTIAGLILLFYFILGGIGMIGSAGKSDPKAAEQAKQTLTSAVMGFVVVFTAYWIVKLLGTLFGIPDII